MSWLAQASATIAGAGQATEAAEAAARAKIGTLPNRSGVPREQGAMQAHLMRCINDELSQHAKQKGISASHQKLYVTMESTVKKVVGRKKSNDHDVYPPPGSCRPPQGLCVNVNTLLAHLGEPSVLTLSPKAVLAHCVNTLGQIWC